MQEIWKDIKGYEGIYQISNHGRIKSFKQNSEGYILKNTNKYGWYFTVNLVKGKARETKRIHRLVAEYFIPNPTGKPQVNHIDGNKQNNHVSNLEWVTSKENMHHCATLNPHLYDGMNKYNQFVKPNTIMQYDLNGNFIAEYVNAKFASNLTGVCARNILQVANMTEYKPGLTRKQAGGYVLKLKNEGR